MHHVWCMYGAFLEFHTVLIVCCDDVKYQSMGVSSLSSLGEIELKQSIQDFFLSIYYDTF